MVELNKIYCEDFIKAFDYLVKLKDVVSLYNLVANGLLTVEQV